MPKRKTFLFSVNKQPTAVTVRTCDRTTPARRKSQRRRRYHSTSTPLPCRSSRVVLVGTAKISARIYTSSRIYFRLKTWLRTASNVSKVFVATKADGRKNRIQLIPPPPPNTQEAMAAYNASCYVVTGQTRHRRGRLEY